jgi:hypothetical protein
VHSLLCCRGIAQVLDEEPVGVSALSGSKEEAGDAKEVLNSNDDLLWSLCRFQLIHFLSSFSPLTPHIPHLVSPSRKGFDLRSIIVVHNAFLTLTSTVLFSGFVLIREWSFSALSKALPVM